MYTREELFKIAIELKEGSFLFVEKNGELSRGEPIGHGNETEEELGSIVTTANRHRLWSTPTSNILDPIYNVEDVTIDGVTVTLYIEQGAPVDDKE